MYFVAICLQFYMRMFHFMEQRIKVDKILCMLEFLFQDVIEKCNLSGDYFNAYLHQNYLEFFSEITDVVRASEYLSDSDFMTFEWSVSDTIVLLSNTCFSIHQVDNLCYIAFFMANTWYNICGMSFIFVCFIFSDLSLLIIKKKNLYFFSVKFLDILTCLILSRDLAFLSQTRSILEEYAASIATRGMLHSNSSRSKHSSTGSGFGWKPLHKPQWYSTCKTVSNMERGLPPSR